MEGWKVVVWRVGLLGRDNQSWVLSVGCLLVGVVGSLGGWGLLCKCLAGGRGGRAGVVRGLAFLLIYFLIVAIIAAVL